MTRSFEEYAEALRLAHADWPRARANLETCQATQDEASYRLLTALDFYTNGMDVANAYFRFLLMVAVTERLYSWKKTSDGEYMMNKREWLARRIAALLERPELVTEIAGDPGDYETRNNLIHGPRGDRVGSEKARELAVKWSAWAGEVLRRILVDAVRIKELGNAPPAGWRPD